MNIFAKKIWQVPIKKHITMFHNQGTRQTGESIDRENKTYSREEGDVTCSTSLNKSTPTKTDSTIPVKNATESRASGVQKSPTEREFPSFSESSSAAMIPPTSVTTASTTVSESSNSDAISRSHSRAVTPKDVTICANVTREQLPSTNDSITRKTKQPQYFLPLSQTCTATTTVVSKATTNNSSRVSIVASEEKNNTNNKKTATLDISSKMPTSIATNRETSLISSKKSGNKTEIKGVSKDNSEQEVIIKTEENKKTYALRRSTINSSLTVPWYKRFPPQAPKVPLFDKTPTSVPYPNLCTYPTMNSKELQGKDMIYSSKVRNLKRGKLKSELGNLKMKFGSVVTSSLVSLKNKETKEKISRKGDTEKKVKLEDASRGVKGKTVKNSPAASQGKQSKQDTTNKKTKQKLPKQGLKGQQNTKKTVEGPASFTDSFRSSTASFQMAPYVHKQKKPSETFTLENWRSSDDKSSFPSTAFSKKRTAGNDSDLKYPAEKRFNPEKKAISLKLKLDPPGNKVNLIHDPKLKFRQEKKVKLVTPYQILKGKEHMERSTSIILKRKTSDDEKQVRYPYDSKGKLVTPSQILKGKEKVGETSGSFPKKSEANYSNPRCYNEESSSDCLHHRNQDDDDDDVYHHDNWKIVEGPSLGETSDKWPCGKEKFEGPSSSGKYEADTTTSTSSCFLERINEEKERRRAKKKEKKAKKMKIRKKKKEKRRKRKERNRGEDEVVTSSHGETDRMTLYGNPFLENMAERHTQQRGRPETEFVPIIDTDNNKQSQSTNSIKTKSLCNVRKL